MWHDLFKSKCNISSLISKIRMRCQRNRSLRRPVWERELHCRNDPKHGWRCGARWCCAGPGDPQSGYQPEDKQQSDKPRGHLVLPFPTYSAWPYQLHLLPLLQVHRKVWDKITGKISMLSRAHSAALSVRGEKARFTQTNTKITCSGHLVSCSVKT